MRVGIGWNTTNTAMGVTLLNRHKPSHLHQMVEGDLVLDG